MKRIILVVSLVLLFAFEITRVYYIMPFPGSQRSDTIDYAYWVDNNIVWLRMVLFALMLNSLIPVFKRTTIAVKTLLILLVVSYGVIFYYFNYRFQADHMFLPPTAITFKDSANNKVDGKKLVVGVVINGEAKAYPIQVIGYHHQVRDSIGKEPVMVTYCTVCRTGRVFSPVVNGKLEDFRLVGMDHFNAMFEDASSKSWWRQATGVAIAGKMKGQALKELPSQQTSLSAWLRKYPRSLILQPDTVFNKQYASLQHFDDGTTKDELEKRDSASWAFKSWVIGVDYGGASKAYDWNQLVENRILHDSFPGLPLVITIEKDTASFHVLQRSSAQGESLHFVLNNTEGMTDINTGSLWSLDGSCVSGPLQGQKLPVVQASQEFWHSWRTFHPNTSKFSYAVH
jgi:hypothetical protein